jgi:LPS-assembly protein
LVARGDARLDFDNTRIRADRITYYQNYGMADANGNVTITHDGSRLIADRLSFDSKEEMFSVDILRTGQWPYYVSGVNAGGTTEDTNIQGATVYYGNPGPFTLNVKSDEVRYVNDEESEYVSMAGSTFSIGSVPVFYLPSYRHYLGGAPYMLDINAGQDSELGYYLQTTTLFPVTSWLRAGLNLDYYTNRGPLAGPTAQYVYNSANQRIIGALSTGAINDTGDDSDRGLDRFDNQIDSSRGFAEWRHKHNIGERFTATASLSYWSDSEVTRDFRDDLYDDNERPDNFAEAVYAGDNYFISAFARFNVNDFQVVQERLPEISFDLLPVPIFNTGAYQRASLSYVRLQEDLSDYASSITTVGESDRFDLTYRLQRPFLLTDWLTFTPLAGARITQYENQEIDSYFLSSSSASLEDSYTREIYEVGFDLEARAYASYPTINETWGIDGLRHLVRPVVHYRYYSDPGDTDEIATIDRETFNLSRPLLDLSDLSNVDEITETHLVRLGVENLFQTRAEGYGSRTLAELNFYQDILFEKELNYEGDEQDTFNATWVELVLTPAPWLKFDLASRFKTESLALEELRTRTTITSGEVWEIGLSTDLLNKQIDQYRLDFIYRINERYAFLTNVKFDADAGQFSKLQFGLRTRLGNTWELLYAIAFREDASREADVEFSIQVRLANGE